MYKLRLSVLGLLLVMVVAPEWPAFQDERYQLNAIVRQRHFDFLVWELEALAAKGEAILTAGHTYLDEESRKQLVLDYLELTGEVRRLENQLNAIYADPAIDYPAVEGRSLETELLAQRAQLATWQPIAEAIVQEQVSAVLVDEGFGVLGQAWPPVQMHMTPLPLILIVSPREEIRQIYNIPLEHGLTPPTQEALEAAVYEDLDHSALVVPIGGLGIYPSMIIETSSINFLADVTAHEWTHHWLTLHPLGLYYGANAAMRTINETVASIAGEEVAFLVIERYYPEFIPPEEPAAPPPATAADPPAFDFYGEMAKTRIRTDELLAAGRIEEAEAYMEARRLLFWENGYRIRKLNQAYFAFYGAYADQPGATGADPIGPAIRLVREHSLSLRAFLEHLAPVTSLEELQALAEEIGN
ncbi:MAG: hypothetical protein L0332_30460 [Chloroflexi bacterium]|nr:hypothetical protein [Chloroflexota bacterium]MCI0578431.1 hypothetical protein [Chloroflexota bacterium]MCI0643877.1 hypothetical protein [Chloroflexota bacterium]MCI0731025.1 hypothetical protein [Chloroflexota bacterium]